MNSKVSVEEIQAKWQEILESLHKLTEPSSQLPSEYKQVLARSYYRACIESGVEDLSVKS